MYQIYADDTLIYDSTIDDYKIAKGSISLEVNKSGSFTFSIYPDHFFYDSFIRLKTVITVYKSGKIIFRGRVLSDVTDYWNNKVLTCEGELGFLNDSIIRPFNFTGTPEALFKRLVTEHNSQVDEFKQFKIGDVTVVDPNNYINRSNTAYESAFSNVNSRLIEDSLGGYIRITHGDDGTDPTPTINYIADYTHVASQTIEFGANLKNYTKSVNANDIATAIIPLGATIDDGDSSTTDRKLTIAGVNNGVDYVYDETAVALYGWIFKTVSWDDVTVAENLKRKAEEYLQTVVNQNVTIELTAIDLHLLDKSIESFNVGDYIRVVSDPHKIASTYFCQKQTIDLLKPDNDTVTLGYSYASFTESTISLQNSISATSNQIKAQGATIGGLNLKTNQYKAAEDQLTALMAQSFGVFKTEEILPNGSTVSYLHDAPTLAESKNVWKMTAEGMAVSTDGGSTWNSGIDASGNAIMNVLSVIGIEASWLNVENLNAICANIGGWKINDSAIYKDVVDPNDSNIVHRVYFQPPLATNIDKTWVLSCQRSTNGGQSFTGNFILHSDGTAQFGSQSYIYPTGRITLQNADFDLRLQLFPDCMQFGKPNTSSVVLQINHEGYVQNMDDGRWVWLSPNGLKVVDENGSLRGQVYSDSGILTIEGNVVASNGASGSFTTADGKIVTVESGIITDIS